MKAMTLLFLILFAWTILSLVSCHKEPLHNAACNRSGTLKDAGILDIPCNGLFIKMDDGTLLQPVAGTQLLNGLKHGDRVQFGYEIMYLGMRSCASTVKLTCVEKK